MTLEQAVELTTVIASGHGVVMGSYLSQSSRRKISKEWGGCTPPDPCTLSFHPHTDSPKRVTMRGTIVTYEMTHEGFQVFAPTWETAAVRFRQQFQAYLNPTTN